MTIRKLSKIGLLLILVGLFFYKYFFYIDFTNGCFVKIMPGYEFNNSTIKRAIKILKYGAPEEYANLCAHVSTINPNLGCGGFNGGCFYNPKQNEQLDGRKIHISTAQGNVLWTAGVLVHETCHAMQYAESRPPSEQECYQADDRVLRLLTQI